MITLNEYINVKNYCFSKYSGDMCFINLFNFIFNEQTLDILDTISLILDYEILIETNVGRGSVDTRYNIINRLSRIHITIDKFISLLSGNTKELNMIERNVILFGLYDVLYCNGELFGNVNDLYNSIENSHLLYLQYLEDYSEELQYSKDHSKEYEKIYMNDDIEEHLLFSIMYRVSDRIEREYNDINIHGKFINNKVDIYIMDKMEDNDSEIVEIFNYIMD